MGDAAIEEIYAMVAAGLSNSQRIVRVHCYPFAMTSENLARYHKCEHLLTFWQNLKQGYDFYQLTRLPPIIEVIDGIYVINDKW